MLDVSRTMLLRKHVRSKILRQDKCLLSLIIVVVIVIAVVGVNIIVIVIVIVITQHYHGATPGVLPLEHPPFSGSILEGESFVRRE